MICYGLGLSYHQTVPVAVERLFETPVNTPVHSLLTKPDAY